MAGFGPSSPSHARTNTHSHTHTHTRALESQTKRHPRLGVGLNSTTTRHVFNVASGCPTADRKAIVNHAARGNF
eukprot:14518210-Alexandrium_andersonii.AAC.1